jgi:transposase-like protein
MTVRITRLEFDAVALRKLAGQATEAPVVRRLLALALVLEGHQRMEAAQRCGMDRQTLRDWVIRYNEQGVAGLSDRPHGGGAPAKLSLEEKAQLAAWVREGPDLAEMVSCAGDCARPAGAEGRCDPPVPGQTNPGGDARQPDPDRQFQEGYGNPDCVSDGKSAIAAIG